MKTAIVGAGLQCKRRAPPIVADAESELVVIASEHIEHARTMAVQFGCEASKDWRAALSRDDVDVALVCTPPYLHAEMTVAALEAGKHVLCEKPLARTLPEAERMVDAAERSGRILKCGFNHRHHAGIWAAKQWADTGELGRPLFARCRYGICGRPGFEKEWRADPAKAAGGHFIEQGIHAVDLFRWFMGELVEVAAMTGNHFFRDMAVDDGGMAVFRTESGATAALHTTLCQWQNLFSFEVFGAEGYAIVEGLGGSYGTERLSTGKRDFDAPFRDVVTHYRGGDVSWKREWEEFKVAIKEGRAPLGDAQDGLAALRAGLAAYASEEKRQFMTIPSC